MAAAAHREVQRIEAATGRVKWRYAVAEGLCGDPVVAGDQVLAATRNGRLVVIDAAKGNSAGFVQFPQALSVGPAVDPSRNLVFQAADSDNLFVLSMPGKRCCQVLPLGHGPGSIVAPPVVFGNYLLVSGQRHGGRLVVAGPEDPLRGIGVKQPTAANWYRRFRSKGTLTLGRRLRASDCCSRRTTATFISWNGPRRASSAAARGDGHPACRRCRAGSLSPLASRRVLRRRRATGELRDRSCQESTVARLVRRVAKGPFARRPWPSGRHCLCAARGRPAGRGRFGRECGQGRALLANLPGRTVGRRAGCQP